MKISRYILKKLLLVAASLLLISCDSSVLWEDEMYAVYWIDNPKNIEFGIKIDDSSFKGRYMPPFSVGSNDMYLVLKRERGYIYN